MFDRSGVLRSCEMRVATGRGIRFMMLLISQQGTQIFCYGISLVLRLSLPYRLPLSYSASLPPSCIAPDDPYPESTPMDRCMLLSFRNKGVLSVNIHAFSTMGDRNLPNGLLAVCGWSQSHSAKAQPQLAVLRFAQLRRKTPSGVRNSQNHLVP